MTNRLPFEFHAFTSLLTIAFSPALPSVRRPTYTDRDLPINSTKVVFECAVGGLDS